MCPSAANWENESPMSITQERETEVVEGLLLLALLAPFVVGGHGRVAGLVVGLSQTWPISDGVSAIC
eukprot:5253589-Amphidinium_carterae.2